MRTPSQRVGGLEASRLPRGVSSPDQSRREYA
jgi:hypothetical protein